MTIDNVGEFAIPFDVVLKFDDNSTESKHYTPEVWEKNQKQLLLNISSNKKVKSVELDGGLFMDYTPIDNEKTL